MKALRTIECRIGADGTPEVRVPLYAGVSGEHNVTELVFAGDAKVFASGDETARISFCGGDGTIVSTDLLSIETTNKGWRVAYALPAFLTVLGGQITARLVLSRIENGEEIQTAMSGGVVLFLDDGGMENGTPFWTAVSQMLDGTVKAAKTVETLVGGASGAVMCYKGEATTEQMLNVTSRIGDVYYNSDHEVFLIRCTNQWALLGSGGDSQQIYVGSGAAPSEAVIQIDPNGETIAFDPVAATSDMKTPVGLDKNGKLWTAASAQSGGVSDDHINNLIDAKISAYDTKVMALLGKDGDSK